jgi:ABC-type branched-subunit amino acid transport system ATPase component
MTPLLEIEGVTKSFGGLRALDGATLGVAEGEIAGLIGPNGSGKTTLFNIVTGYARADAGDVRFRGRSISSARPDRIFALGIGRTFQLTRIFSRLSVLENMLVATQRHEAWARSVFRAAGSPAERMRALELLDFVGIAKLANLPANNLSYGQRKLLELAYVLVADPDVILLDEPAGGVNPSLLHHIADRLRAVNASGKTLLIVEHDMEFVMGLCSRITVLDQGRALTTGTPEEVQRDPAVLDAYLGGAEDDDEELDVTAVQTGVGSTEPAKKL